jgi:hypothetical protein
MLEDGAFYSASLAVSFPLRFFVPEDVGEFFRADARSGAET